MSIFLGIFLGIVCAVQLPLILRLLYQARKIILGLAIAAAICFGTVFMNARFKEEQERLKYAKADAAFAARFKHSTELVANYKDFRGRGGLFHQLTKEEQDEVKAAFHEHSQDQELEHDTLMSEMAANEAWLKQNAKEVAELNRKRDEEKRFEEAAHAQTGFFFGPKPLYVNPKLVPTPPPVVKPTPTPLPAPKVEVETLYTSK